MGSTLKGLVTDVSVDQVIGELAPVPCPSSGVATGDVAAAVDQSPPSAPDLEKRDVRLKLGLRPIVAVGLELIVGGRKAAACNGCASGPAAATVVV